MTTTNAAQKQEARVMAIKKESKKGKEYFQLVSIDAEGKFHNIVGPKGNQVLLFPVKSGKGHLSLFESNGGQREQTAVTFASVMSSL